MIWAIAAAVAILLIHLFLNQPSRKSRALCYSAMRAGKRGNWTLAANFCAEAHATAGKLKEPARSRMQALVDIQWAHVLHRQGRLAEAREKIERGIADTERLFAAPPGILAGAYLWWGDLCMDLNLHQDAEAHYRHAFEDDVARDNLLGIISDLQRLADCLLSLDRRADAEPVIERAIAAEIRQTRELAAARGHKFDEHRITPLSASRLHLCRGEYDDACRVYRFQIERWCTPKNRPNNIDPGLMYLQLAVAEERAGRFEEAARAYEEAASAFERDWCPGHPRALAARDALASLESRALTARLTRS
ncbi:MAG: hypothetical protein JST11_11560 [Acidobacteria bacterium]|nr:hypothetical protein [Acidobacteriota bacterium]